VITSVHSFTQSAVGPVLLWFLMVVLVASFGLFAVRVNVVASSPRLDSLASREGVFLVNNLLLTVFAFVVLVGTLYPIFVEAFTGDQVGVGPPFFNRMAIPISFALLLAMGIGPVTPYRKARASIVWERIRMPLRLALAAGAIAVLFRHRSPLLLLGVLTASFVCFVILRNLYHSARTLAQKREMALPAALLRAMRSDPGYWGGQLSHLGVALLALGIALSSSLAVETDAVLIRGETVNVAGYDITYVDQFFREESHRSVIGADLEVRRGDRLVARQQPRLNQYGSFSQTVATPAVHISLSGDLYFTLQSINSERVALSILWFPYIWLVWVGGFLTGLAVLWSRLVRKPARRKTPEPAVAAGES
jgi:cytochrome c-type biogenesis protein CcmF